MSDRRQEIAEGLLRLSARKLWAAGSDASGPHSLPRTAARPLNPARNQISATSLIRGPHDD